MVKGSSVPYIKRGWLRPYNLTPPQIVVLLFNLILKKCHRSVNLYIITFVVMVFQSFLKGVFTLVEDVLVISESIYYFGSGLYTGAFVEFYHIRYSFLVFWQRFPLFKSYVSLVLKKIQVTVINQNQLKRKP